MITCVSDIMSPKIYTIDAYDGVCKAERIMEEKGICCLAVLHNGKLLGVLTGEDVRRTHPNRIVVDAMLKEYVSVSPNTSLWKAREIFEENRIDSLLVESKGDPIGVVSKSCLYEELGKRCDLLTGLYKSEYIYQTGMELLENGDTIAIIFIDINNFGQIDKELGHIKGDSILSRLGTLLKEQTIDNSYMCRFGGDEFVILRKYDSVGCIDFAEKLLGAISTDNYPDNVQVTASAGIAVGSRNERNGRDSFEMIKNLINSASLASTKAKKLKISLYVAEDILEDTMAFV